MSVSPRLFCCRLVAARARRDGLYIVRRSLDGHAHGDGAARRRNHGRGRAHDATARLTLAA